MEPTVNPQNYTPIQIQDFQPQTQSSTKKLNVTTIVLILSLCAFLISVAYSTAVQKNLSMTSANYQANMPPTQVPEFGFPKQYKRELIPDALYSGAKLPDPVTGEKFINDYIKDQAMRFYIYKDILAENDIPATPTAAISNFAGFRKDVAMMEQLVKKHLLMQDSTTRLDDIINERKAFFIY